MIGRARPLATAEPVHGGGGLGAPGMAEQIAKPGDKIAILQIDELRDDAAHKSEAFP